MGMKNFGVGIALKNNAEAVEFYMKIFGLELGFNAKFPDGTYQHATLQKDGKKVFDVVNLTHEFDAQKQISCWNFIGKFYNIKQI